MKRLQKTAIPVESSDSDEDKIKLKNKNISKTSKTASNYSPKTGNDVKSSFLSLESSMNDKTLQVFKNDSFVCIRDKYPKSKIHLLLIPLLSKRMTKVENLIQIPNSIDFLHQIRNTTNEIINSSDNLKNSKLIIGFHAVQSMSPLHMHIISDDFKSDCLKNKKHWNSFTTNYFIRLEDLINHLEIDLDNLKKDYFIEDKFNLRNRGKLDDFLKSDLKCNKCGSSMKNIPNLKNHLNTH